MGAAAARRKMKFKQSSQNIGLIYVGLLLMEPIAEHVQLTCFRGVKL